MLKLEKNIMLKYWMAVYKFIYIDWTKRIIQIVHITDFKGSIFVPNNSINYRVNVEKVRRIKCYQPTYCNFISLYSKSIENEKMFFSHILINSLSSLHPRLE